MTVRRFLPAVIPAAVVLLLAALTVPAHAAPATSQTQHFSSVQSWGTPTGTPTNNTNCTGAVGSAFANDFVLLDLTGNGVQHQTVNGAGDAWFTTTFTGTGTVTFYPGSSLIVVVDNQGNIVGNPTIIGPPDMITSVKITDWFGFEANHSNAVGHGTIDARGTTLTGALIPAGQAVAFHDQTSLRWAVGADPFGPPTSFTNNITCP